MCVCVVCVRACVRACVRVCVAACNTTVICLLSKIIMYVLYITTTLHCQNIFGEASLCVHVMACTAAAYYVYIGHVCACVCAGVYISICIAKHITRMWPSCCICQSLITHRLLPPDYLHFTFHHLSLCPPGECGGSGKVWPISH